MPSYIEAGRSDRSDTNDSFEALKKLIRDEKIATDLVICGGDLSDKAGDVGIAHAWKELHELGVLTKAVRTLAVCGNHDLDSRYFGDRPDPDPKGTLQELKPMFGQRQLSWRPCCLTPSKQAHMRIYDQSCSVCQIEQTLFSYRLAQRFSH